MAGMGYGDGESARTRSRGLHGLNNASATPGAIGAMQADVADGVDEVEGQPTPSETRQKNNTDLIKKSTHAAHG